MNYLRQSTAIDVPLGPFVDATDGATPETGLTISQADVRLKKNAGAWAQVNDATSATHEEAGWYEKELDATDTNTVGTLIISVQESGALPVWHEYTIIEEAVYDALFAASALGYVANAPVTLADAVAHGGTLGSSTATFAMSRINVTSQTANTSAVTATGNGTGHGVNVSSGTGATGNGITVAAASTNGHGISAAGIGTGSGVIATGGATGHGINGVGGATSGNGIRAAGTAGNSAAVNAVGQGSAAGILSTGGATGAGMSLVGGATSGLGLAIDYTAPLGSSKQLGLLESGTLQSATATTAVLRAATSFSDDNAIGATLAIVAGTGIGQSRLITDWVSATDTATVATWATTPDNTSIYEVYRTAPSSAGAGGGDATEAKQDIIIALIGTPAGASVSADIAAVEAQTDDIGAAGAGLSAIPWNAAWDAEVQSEATDALNAYDPPTRAEATSDANSILAAVDVVDNLLDTEMAAVLAAVDTEVAAIKAKTDQLIFTIAGQVDATTVTNSDKTGYTLTADIRIKKNTALANFTFLMVDTSDVPATGLTVTAERSLDGGALGSMANSVTEISNGLYKINLAAADTNADICTYRFTAAASKDRIIMFPTQTE